MRVADARGKVRQTAGHNYGHRSGILGVMLAPSRARSMRRSASWGRTSSRTSSASAEHGERDDRQPPGHARKRTMRVAHPRGKERQTGLLRENTSRTASEWIVVADD